MDYEVALIHLGALISATEPAKQLLRLAQHLHGEAQYSAARIACAMAADVLETAHPDKVPDPVALAGVLERLVLVD